MEFHEDFRYSINFDYECRFEEECTFCNEFVGNLEKTLFYQVIGNKVRSRILKETNNFVVIPTVGQIIEGYLLIMPKKHYLSMGHLPDSFYPELESLYYETKNILTKYYANPVFFEHGSVSRLKRGGCCVDHAHIHVFPSSIDLTNELNKHFIRKKIQYLHDLQEPIKKGKPYLFFEDINENRSVYEIDIIPSQYLRQLSAKAVDRLDKWNWRSYVGEQEMLNTINKLAYWKDR